MLFNYIYFNFTFTIVNKYIVYIVNTILRFKVSKSYIKKNKIINTNLTI